MSFTIIMHQTNNILNTNPLHFITFSLLFLPLTISFTTLVLFYFSASADITTILTFKTIIIIFVIPPTFTAATALITYTAHKTIHHTKPTFTSTVKSLSHPFFPLFTTLIAETMVLLPFALAILLSFSDVTESVKSFKFSKAFGICYLVYLILFFKSVFAVAAPIAVLESKHGFASLTKSENQLVGLRKCACFIFLSTVWLIVVLLGAIVRLEDSKCAFKWIFAVEFGIVNLISCLMILEFVVANTVLYEVTCGDEEAVKSAVGYRNEGLGYSRVLYLLYVVLLAPFLCNWL